MTDWFFILNYRNYNYYITFSLKKNIWHKIIKFLIVFCITTIFYINFYNVYGSFADFTDGDARNQTEKMEQEQNKKFDTLKSNNN